MIDNMAGRLIIIILAASTVSVASGVVIGRYAIPNKGPTQDSASALPAPRADGRLTPSASAQVLVPTPSPSSGATPTQEAVPASRVPGVPTRINEFGIPVGYPRTQGGAVSACANYDAINGNLKNREPANIRKLYASVAKPETATKLANLIIANDKESAKRYGIPSLQTPNFGFIGRGIGYSVQSYNPDKANVTIWGVLGFGLHGSPDENLTPREGWGTVTCTVSWNNGDWILEDAGDGPISPAITDRAAEGFREFLLVGAGP